MGGPAGDDGRADPRLLAAVTGYDAGPAARAEVLAALAGARVFLALQARAAAPQEGLDPAVAHGPAGRRTELSLLVLAGADSRRALPAFLAGDEVSRWRPGARPLPLPGPQACGAARDTGAHVLLLDPAGAAVVVVADELAELAAGRVPVAGAALSSRLATDVLHAGPVPAGLAAAAGAALRGEPVVAARLLAGPAGPVLGVVPRRPLGPAELTGLAARVAGRLGADLPPGGLDLTVVPATGPGRPVPLAGWRDRLRRPGR